MRLHKILIAASLISATAVLGGRGLPLAQATPELDRQYALETVGFIRAYDNVDGLFEDYVAQAYRAYFAQQTRFVFNDLSKGDSVLSQSKIAYSKLIDDPEVLGQLARSTRSQAIVRTKIIKEGPLYRFTLDWLHSPRMDVIANESFQLEQLGDIKKELQSGVQRLAAKLPFLGHVTGRDGSVITLNLGSHSYPDLKVGDTVMISTLDAVKKHPLLRQIVEWRFTPTGRAVIEQVDEAISFARINEELNNRSIARYQKVVQILPKPVDAAEPTTNETRERDPLWETPTYGYVLGSLGLGTAGRDYSTASSTTSLTGSGLLVQPSGEAELWLTRAWFANLGLGYGFWSHEQTNKTTSAVTSGSPFGGSVSRFKLAGGYSYSLTGDFFGPRGWVKLGFKSTSYSFPTSSTELTTPTSFKSLFVGIGGELPIRDRYGFNINVDFGLFPSGEESPILASTPNSATDVAFAIGGYYQFAPRLRFRLSLDFATQGLDFASGATTSFKTLTIAPAVLYYF